MTISWSSQAVEVVSQVVVPADIISRPRYRVGLRHRRSQSTGRARRGDQLAAIYLLQQPHKVPVNLKAAVHVTLAESEVRTRDEPCKRRASWTRTMATGGADDAAASIPSPYAIRMGTPEAPERGIVNKAVESLERTPARGAEPGPRVVLVTPSR